VYDINLCLSLLCFLSLSLASYGAREGAQERGCPLPLLALPFPLRGFFEWKQPLPPGERFFEWKKLPTAPLPYLKGVKRKRRDIKHQKERGSSPALSLPPVLRRGEREGSNQRERKQTLLPLWVLLVPKGRSLSPFPSSP